MANKFPVNPPHPELPVAGSRDEMIKTLDSVYRKRGSAPEIRAAIEAECVAQKQQAADTAAAIKALQTQQAGSPPAPAPAKAADTELAAEKTSASETGPSASCMGWRSELNSVNEAFRRGGNAATMEQLQTRRRGVERRMAESRC